MVVVQISVAMALRVSAAERVMVKRRVLSGHGASRRRRPEVHSSNSAPEGLKRSGKPSALSSIMRPPEAMAAFRTSFSALLMKGETRTPPERVHSSHRRRLAASSSALQARWMITGWRSKSFNRKMLP